MKQPPIDGFEKNASSVRAQHRLIHAFTWLRKFVCEANHLRESCSDLQEQLLAMLLLQWCLTTVLSS
uniref:Uncharacterized protein n=1 Tax=Trichuris muris TaxID=70415 RepID=A0A5S6R2A8_TRIMR